MNPKRVLIGAVAVLLIGYAAMDSGVDGEPRAQESGEQTGSTAPGPTAEATGAERRRTRAETATSGGASGWTALGALALLPVEGRGALTGYDRDRFGAAWLDADRNGCDTRNDILAEQLQAIVLEGNGCVVASGVRADPYTGSRIVFWQGHGALIDIDHVVAMANAWVTGAAGWPIEKRAAFANDPLNLLAVDAGANRQKGDGDAATWLPPNKPFRCRYVARQVAVKAKYDLWVTAPEAAAVARVLSACPQEPVTADPWRTPTVVDHDITDPAEGRAETVPPPTAPVPGPADQSVYFGTCDAARAAGAAPVHRGDPGYGTHLDRDGDGSGCE